MQKTNSSYTMAWLMILLMSLCSCAKQTQSVDTVNPANQKELQELAYEVTAMPEETKLSQLRVKSLEDTAMSLGAQGGLAWASEKINKRLEKDKWHLESTYNFNAMLLSHAVLPPVLSQGDNSLNLADPDTIRIADRTYKILQQARFVTTPPSWRDYLWLPYHKPEMPNKVLLPKNADEQKVWRKSIEVGWNKGIEQAYSIFHQNLARLKRDYEGMILYRKLLHQKMISAPYVSKAELGITGDGNDMRINDQVLRITSHPQLQTNSNHWRAVVVKNDDN